MNDQIKSDEAEKVLIKKVLGGDRNAFGEVIRNTEGLVRQVVYRMIIHAEDRKDLEQEIYLRVFKDLQRFERRSKLSTWIAKIAYNTCLNYLAKKKLILTGNEDYPMEAEEKTEPLVFNKQLSAILAKEIENLSPLYRILIILYHQEELPYAEIAQITGLPAGTVKSYLFRARSVLRNNILGKYKKGRAMMDKHLSDTQLQQLVLGEISNDDSVHQHIAFCEQCKMKMLDFRSMFVEISKLPKPIAEHDLSGLVLARLSQSAATHRQDTLIYILVFAAFGSMALPVYLLWDYFIKIADGVAPLVIWVILTLAIVILVAGSVRLYRDYKKKIATIHLHTGLI